MNKQINKELFDFINASPTAFHAVENIAGELISKGFTELYEWQDWELSAPGSYFVRRNASSIIAFSIPGADFAGFMIMAAHSDAPSFRVKDNASVKAAGLYTQLNVERYGGMIFSSWMDRPLSLAGRIAVRSEKGIASKLVNIDRDLLMIPNVAIHMDRSVNDGKSFNPNVDMLPLISSASSELSLDGIIAEAAGVKEEDIISKDLFLYPRAPGFMWGAEDEFISSPRLDDLQCAFACMKGFLNSAPGGSVSVLSVFDNEEVGSGTKQGAASGFLSHVLERLCACFGRSLHTALANSFMVSADNAHAVHPNHPEYADRNDRPVLNGGVVIKFNANQRYTSDAVSTAVFAEICREAGVPVQRYSNRGDLPGGSTLGNISSSHVSIDCVDIGLPQLAMHSALETAGAEDTAYLIRAAELFYSRSFRRSGEGLSL